MGWLCMFVVESPEKPRKAQYMEFKVRHVQELNLMTEN